MAREPDRLAQHIKYMIKNIKVDNVTSNKKYIIETAMSDILSALGEDIGRPGLRDTPKRVARSLSDLTAGMHMTPADVIGDGIFPSESDGMIMQKKIEFYSLCEHHLLPFFGHVHIAYFPDKKIIGLSKLGRVVDIYARRLQLQERLTQDIARGLSDLLHPKGMAVAIEAHHLCMMMRGVNKQNAVTMTRQYDGVFENDMDLRTEFLQAIK